MAKEIKGKLDCIGENMEKYITFSAPITKNCDDGKTITRKLMFIDSFRVISASLSGLVDNMSRVFIRNVCKNSWKEKKSIQTAILMGYKIID